MQKVYSYNLQNKDGSSVRRKKVSSSPMIRIKIAHFSELEVRPKVESEPTNLYTKDYVLEKIETIYHYKEI